MTAPVEPAWEAAALRYRALAQPTRLRLLDALSPVPRRLAVTQLAGQLGVSVAATSRHAAMLSAQGFIERERIGMEVACWLTGAGEAVLRHVWAAPSAAGAGGHDVAIEPLTLAEEDPELVELYIGMGATRLKYAGRDEWDWHMVGNFGEAVRPHLDVLHAAILRLERGEPLDGLALPEAVLRDGVDLGR